MQGLTEGLNGPSLILRVFEILGVVVGLAVLLSYFLLKTFSSKWLEAKFQERLERFRHAQNRELEELRLKIYTLFDSTTRLHQHEFMVMPEAWAKLNDAFYKTMALVSPFQQYPDLIHMSAEHFSEFVASCQLGSWERNELKGLSAQERNGYYIDHVYWPRLVDRRNIVRDAHVYLMKTGIFLRHVIKDRFTKLSEMVLEALAEDEFHQQHRDIRPEVREKREALRKHGEGLLKELESIMNVRLWGDREKMGMDKML